MAPKQTAQVPPVVLLPQFESHSYPKNILLDAFTVNNMMIEEGVSMRNKVLLFLGRDGMFFKTKTSFCTVVKFKVFPNLNEEYCKIFQGERPKANLHK